MDGLPNLIGISGRINSGKDTVGKIIQILHASPHFTNEGIIKFLDKELPKKEGHYEIKKFADKLKDIVCLLLGCNREQLEDREFKEKELGKEWDYWRVVSKYETLISISRQEVLESYGGYYTPELIKLTPRKLLQLLGTECGRNIIHPNIWVNSLFSDYKYLNTKEAGLKYLSKGENTELLKPKWIITDVRFPNEKEAIEKRDGTTIKVIRPQPVKVGESYSIRSLYGSEIVKNVICSKDNRGYDDYVFVDEKGYIHRKGEWDVLIKNEHESETSLDNANFDIIIHNDLDLNSLINKIRKTFDLNKKLEK